LGDLIGRVAKDSKHAAGGLVGVDEGWPINAEMSLHYSDEDAEAEFAGVHFTGEALGMIPRQPWTPEADIKLPE
jgi:hypothetical protein